MDNLKILLTGLFEKSLWLVNITDKLAGKYAKIWLLVIAQTPHGNLLRYDQEPQLLISFGAYVEKITILRNLTILVSFNGFLWPPFALIILLAVVKSITLLDERPQGLGGCRLNRRWLILFFDALSELQLLRWGELNLLWSEISLSLLGWTESKFLTLPPLIAFIAKLRRHRNPAQTLYSIIDSICTIERFR